MNLTEKEIEVLLRRAPHPHPPAGLKERLLPPSARPSHPAPAPRSPAWWPRWWPALAAASVTLVCLGVLAKQQSDIIELRHALDELQSATPVAPARSNPADDASAAQPPQAPTIVIPGGSEEIARLRATVQQLTQEIAELERLRQANNQQRQQRAAETTLTDEFKAVVQARDEAKSIVCVNNLKQLGLAARIWETDNGDRLPPTWLAMTNEMRTPKILVCPADTGRQAAPNWASLTAANVSYEFLMPSGSLKEPQRVMFRCRVHGHVTYCDGSVQKNTAELSPETLKRNEPVPAQGSSPSSQPIP